MSPTDIAREYFGAWNSRNFDRMRDLMDPDYSYTGGDGQELRGPEAGLAVARMFAAAFPDGRIDITRVKDTGDAAIIEFVGRGTHGGDFMGIAPTGKAVNIPVCNILELRDGKVYREREYMDMANIMAQLGLMPAGAPV